MSVSSILTSLQSSVSTTLGADWKELDYVYALEDNNFRDGDLRYGIGADSGDTVIGVNKSATFDFSFFVILTKSFINRSCDAKERVALSEIYDEFSAIDISVFQKKLNNASVLLVQDISYDSPNRIDKGTISVRVNFTIKFRNTL